MNRMKQLGRSGVALLALAAGLAQAPLAAAHQQAQPPAPSPGTPIGNPQLRDFDLAPRQRPAPQPQPTPPPPTAQPAQQQPQQQQPRATPRPTEQAPRTAPAPAARQAPDPVRAPAREQAPPPVREQAPSSAAPAPEVAAPAAPAPSAETAPPASGTRSLAPLRPEDALPFGAGPASETQAPSGSLSDPDGPPLWLVLLGGLGLGLIGYTIFTRRRGAQRRRDALPEAIPATAVQPSAPRVPRPDPVPRPWLEIELTPERTTADPEESVVEFELVIRNNGGSPARGVKLQAKLINSTPDQDKEIAAFHRKKPGEHRTLDIPDIQAGQELRLKGRVDIKREDIKALRMQERLLWVPLVAVNAFYGWGSARTGQTSKSFLVGREQPETKDKMAPFRLDLGPRVYRTLGQRPYKIERRV